MLPEGPHLLVAENGAILIATLNRPDKLNAVTGQMMQSFEAALQRFRDTPGLKVMLVRATGRYFCSGVDLRANDGSSPPRTGVGEQMGTAKLAIEMARNVERLANSALMLNPEYLAGIERYIQNICGKHRTG